MIRVQIEPLNFITFFVLGLKALSLYLYFYLPMYLKQISPQQVQPQEGIFALSCVLALDSSPFLFFPLFILRICIRDDMGLDRDPEPRPDTDLYKSLI